MADEPFDYAKHLPPELQSEAENLRTTGQRRPGKCVEIVGWHAGSDGNLAAEYCGHATPPNGSWCPDHVALRVKPVISTVVAKRCLACGSERGVVKYSLVHDVQRHTSITAICGRCAEALVKAIQERLSQR